MAPAAAATAGGAQSMQGATARQAEKYFASAYPLSKFFQPITQSRESSFNGRVTAWSCDLAVEGVYRGEKITKHLGLCIVALSQWLRGPRISNNLPASLLLTSAKICVVQLGPIAAK